MTDLRSHESTSSRKPMAAQPTLIKLIPASSTSALEAVRSTLRMMGAQVLLTSSQGKFIIVLLDPADYGAIRSHPAIELVGGVEIRSRTVRKIRSRNQSTAEPAPTRFSNPQSQT